MNYLALHIDMDFLVSTICADENPHSFPIKDGNEDFLWLYFYNDPYQHIVSFGRENQKHCSKGETNYYGNFIELIENENNTFSIGEYSYPIIELLRHSKLIEKLKKAFAKKTLESSEDIPTLLTFSLSVSELAKQKLVEYLNSQGFNIVSYTIPLSELSCFCALTKNNVNFVNGNIVAFLEASNSDLHLMKLMFSTDYFLLDGKPETKKGLGIDPRKRALLKFVVNKIGTMGVLSEQEKETEYKIMEPKTDEWLHKLDLQTNNCPVEVTEALSRMQNAKRRVLLYKDKIAEFTGSDIQLILDNYNDYINRNVNQGVAAIFLLGNCFQNDIIKKKFENLIGKDKLFFYANKDIQDILAMYPKIDITRYASEEARIKEHAKAEEQKRAEQRALEDKQRRKQEEEDKRQAEATKAEQNRRDAQMSFERAVELEKEGQLQYARVNVENAVSLDPTNREYKQFLSDLADKIKNLNAKDELYKDYLSKADKSLATGDLEKAIEEYEAAKFVSDNAEIIQKIIAVKRLIKDKKQQETKLSQLFSEVQSLINQKDYPKAKIKIDEILSVNKEDAKAKLLLAEVEHLEEQQEKQRQEQENKSKCEKALAAAENLFKEEKWPEAKRQYEMALTFCPQETNIKDKIAQCDSKIREQESAFSELILEATIAEKKGNLSEALSLLEKALKIKPDDADIKKRINNIKFKLEFGTGNTPKNNTEPTPPKDDDFLPVKEKITSKTKTDDDWGFSKKVCCIFCGKPLPNPQASYCSKCGKKQVKMDW